MWHKSRKTIVNECAEWRSCLVSISLTPSINRKIANRQWKIISACQDAEDTAISQTVGLCHALKYYSILYFNVITLDWNILIETCISPGNIQFFLVIFLSLICANFLTFLAYQLCTALSTRATLKKLLALLHKHCA